MTSSVRSEAGLPSPKEDQAAQTQQSPADRCAKMQPDGPHLPPCQGLGSDSRHVLLMKYILPLLKAMGTACIRGDRRTPAWAAILVSDVLAICGFSSSKLLKLRLLCGEIEHVLVVVLLCFRAAMGV